MKQLAWLAVASVAVMADPAPGRAAESNDAMHPTHQIDKHVGGGIVYGERAGGFLHVTFRHAPQQPAGLGFHAGGMLLGGDGHGFVAIVPVTGRVHATLVRTEHVEAVTSIGAGAYFQGLGGTGVGVHLAQALVYPSSGFAIEGALHFIQEPHSSALPSAWLTVTIGHANR